jgi:hypothetical protein
LGKPGDCNLPDIRYVVCDSGDVNNRLYASLARRAGSFLRKDDVRFWGQSGHPKNAQPCLLLTQSGHSILRIVAKQK